MHQLFSVQFEDFTQTTMVRHKNFFFNLYEDTGRVEIKNKLLSVIVYRIGKFIFVVLVNKLFFGLIQRFYAKHNSKA